MKSSSNIPPLLAELRTALALKVDNKCKYYKYKYKANSLLFDVLPADSREDTVEVCGTTQPSVCSKRVRAKGRRALELTRAAYSVTRSA